MSDLVMELRPERWKIFEVLPVEGQNDGDVDDILQDGEFNSWVERHKWVADEGIQFVPENNELMRGSYAMLSMHLEGSTPTQKAVIPTALPFLTWESCALGKKTASLKIDFMIVEVFTSGIQMLKATSYQPRRCLK